MRKYIVVDAKDISLKQLAERGFQMIHMPYHALQGHTRTKWQLFPEEKYAIDAARKDDKPVPLEEYMKLFEMDALNEAALYYQELLYSNQGNDARKYLKDRGLSDETIRKYALGYSGGTRDGLYQHLKEKGYSIDSLTQIGLFYFRMMAAHDYFRNRIMFPIMDDQGNVISFGGRALDGEGPMYLHTPDTSCFDKKRTIYGLHLAKESGKTELILCEGYLDVILLHQEGFANAVSTPWSSLTKEQAAVLKQHVDSVILSYDSDEAGKRGAARSAKLLQKAGLKVKKLDVSPYRDPYELLRKGGKNEYARRL